MSAQFIKNQRTGSVLVFSFILMFAATAWASPVVDGRYDVSEGYTIEHDVSFTVERSDITVTGGKLRMHQDAATGDVTLLFSLPLTLVDNTYGDNTIGWGKGVAPSGKNHNFKDLIGSDKCQFVFTNGLGNTVLDMTMDYFSETAKDSGIYLCQGATGSDGQVDTGSAADLIAWGSSLGYNFNTLGHVLTEHSPLTNDDYDENPLYPGWIFEVIYELKISGSAFGQSGFGDVTIPITHISPNKIGKNKTYPEIPEPATLSLLAMGLVAISTRRRFRQV